MARKVLDTYFLDWRDALEEARQGRRVPITIAATGSQVCYYAGDRTIPGVPKTMVRLSLPEIPEFFLRKDLRMPAEVRFPKGLGDRAAMENFGRAFMNSLEEAHRLRKQRSAELLARTLRRPAPAYDPAAPLRVLLPTSRYTTVMQHCSRGLARAFERLGQTTGFLIEDDDRELLSALRIIEAVHDFDPHLVIQINHLNNLLFHPGLVNVSWWQDPMPEISRGGRLPWRTTNLSYVLARNPFEDMLVRTGLPRERVEVQMFCIDPEVFIETGGPPRRNAIVFIGSSARNVLDGSAGERSLIEHLTPRVLAGEPLRHEDIESAADRFGVSRDHAWFHVHHYLVRDLPVRWMCEARGDVEVEVYGRFWDRDEVVAPFYRGEVPHGPAVAEIYRSARYALSCHSQLVQNGRLAEAAACGAIPVVFDCRYHAEPPFWDDRCLFFRTPEGLRECLGRDVPTAPGEFRDHYSYDRFAARILDRARAVLEAREAALTAAVAT